MVSYKKKTSKATHMKRNVSYLRHHEHLTGKGFIKRERGSRERERDETSKQTTRQEWRKKAKRDQPMGVNMKKQRAKGLKVQKVENRGTI
jgi:hypothetical protein